MLSNVESLPVRICEVLSAYGVSCDPLGLISGPSIYRIGIRPRLGVKVAKVKGCAEDLQVQLGLAETPLIAPRDGGVAIDIPRADRQSCLLHEYVPDGRIASPSDPLRFPLGVQLNNQVYWLTLSDAESCHILGAGTTGSGKSALLKTIAIALCGFNQPEHLKLAIIDPKKVTFVRFRDLPWLYQGRIFTDTEQAATLLAELATEVNQRYERFAVAGVEDITSYNALKLKQRKPQEVLPRIVVIADEFAQLSTNPDYKDALDRALEILGEMARAAGIHLIFFTQRPSTDVVIPRLRANLPQRIALKVADIHNSAIILGDKVGDAAHLLGRGDMLVGGQGSKLLRLQALFATDELIDRFVGEHRVVHGVNGSVPPEVAEKWQQLCQLQGNTAKLKFFEPNASKGGSYWRRGARRYNPIAKIFGAPLIPEGSKHKRRFKFS